MKITNGDVFGTRETLPELLKERLPIKTSYWLARLTKKLQEHLQVIEELRMRLVKEYGVENAETHVIEVAPGKVGAFYTEFNEVLAQEIEIDFNPVELPSDGLNIEPRILLALDKFITVKE